MKKFLLGTTALISLSAATAAMAGGSHAPAEAAPANTGGLTVMLGGKFNFQSVFRDEDRDTAGTGVVDATNRNMFFRNDTTLNVTAAGSSENFDYGAVVELVGDSNGDKNGTSDARKSYLYVENDSFGRFEAGANVGASTTLEVDASKIARGTGGIDGDWNYNLDKGNNTTAGFIETPNLPTADENTNAGNANKITYYTPRFSGLQLGVSFTPDSGNRGSASSITSDNGTDFSEVFAGGLNYQSDVEGVGVMASAVGEAGNAEANSTNDLSAYSLGLGLEFEGFSLVGNWADESDSGLASSATVNTDQTYWSAGAAYENGPYGVSVTYFNSERGTGAAASTNGGGSNKLENVVVGADYQMAPGLTPFVEASFFQYDSGATAAANDDNGNVILVGAEVAF